MDKSKAKKNQKIKELVQRMQHSKAGAKFKTRAEAVAYAEKIVDPGKAKVKSKAKVSKVKAKTPKAKVSKAKAKTPKAKVSKAKVSKAKVSKVKN